MVWVVLQDYAENIQEMTINGAYARLVNMDIIWYHCKKIQIPNLTSPCWRDRWDDQNGHLDHPIWSSDGEITPPGKSPTRTWQAVHHKWPSTLPHSLGDSPMDPQTLGCKPKVRVRLKGLICPSNWLPKGLFDVGLIIQGLDLHLHARKHKENQCQPLDGS